MSFTVDLNNTCTQRKQRLLLPVFSVATEKWFHITAFLWRAAGGGKRGKKRKTTVTIKGSQTTLCISLLSFKCTIILPSLPVVSETYSFYNKL